MRGKTVAIFFLFFILSILLSKAVLFDFYKVTSSSMERTLFKNDFVLVNKVLYGFQSPNKICLPFFEAGIKIPAFSFNGISDVDRGDVLVFRYDNDEDGMLVKRCVALEGDVVEIIDKKLYVNGKAEDVARFDGVCYGDSISHVAVLGKGKGEVLSYGRDNFGPLVVPKGTFFALGDNRDYSYDSRFIGCIDRGAVIGKVVLIYFSYNEMMTNYIEGICWGRIFKVVY